MGEMRHQVFSSLCASVDGGSEDNRGWVESRTVFKGEHRRFKKGGLMHEGWMHEEDRRVMDL